MTKIRWINRKARSWRVLAVSAGVLLLFVSVRAQVAAHKRIQVRNAGVPGQNSAEGRSRFVADVVRLRPGMVVLYFGVNDTVNETKAIPIETYLENMEWMIDTARRSEIEPVIVTIQHVDEVRLLQRHPASAYGVEGPNGRIDRFNRALRALAARRGVAIADFSVALDGAGGPTAAMSPDGVHLGIPGYTLLAETVFQAMPAGKEAGVVVCIGDSLTYGTPLRTAEHDSPDVYPAVLERLLNGVGGQIAR